MSAADIAVILGALGVGSVLPKILDGLIGWVTGRQQVERTRYREALTDAERSERDRDREASMRRRVSEHASELRRMLIDRGVPASDIPAWPIPPREQRKEHP